MMSILRKYGARLGIALLIYFFFKVTSSDSIDEIYEFDLQHRVLLGFAIVVVLIVWEVCERVIFYFVKKYPTDFGTKRRLFQMFTVTTFISFPLISASIYFDNYYLKVWLNCIEESQLSTEFWSEIAKGYVLAWLIISSIVIKLYYERAGIMERDRAEMQKELLRAKYEGLKNQINPHFLFNSFSVLTTLIHHNTQLASNFLSKLSKMYRYILDNKENQMVSLDSEFEFLESYIFLLKTRHEESIKIEIMINIDKKRFFLPTLSLQMLIENAVKHNSFTCDDPLIIKIFNEGNEFIVVKNEVRKNFSKINSTKVGLENIKKRYIIQSDKQMVIHKDESYFIVKLPILSRLKVA